MGAEVEAHVWCDGPKNGGGECLTGGDNNEYGSSIKSVREFLAGLGWVTRKRDGETVDMCKLCKEEK